jgi:hypothetical protein
MDALDATCHDARQVQHAPGLIAVKPLEVIRDGRVE